MADKVGTTGVVTVPKLQPVTVLDHYCLPPAAFARFAGEDEMAWRNIVPSGWQCRGGGRPAQSLNHGAR